MESKHLAAHTALKFKLCRAAAQADQGRLIDPAATLKKIEKLRKKRAARKS
jgi:hypothetical protein